MDSGMATANMAAQTLVRSNLDFANHDGCHANLMILSTSSLENIAEHTTDGTKDGMYRVFIARWPTKLTRWCASS